MNKIPTPKFTNYKGYTISTQIDGHCSLIYKGEKFVGAVAAENSEGNVLSIVKAKQYIDNLKTTKQ